MCEKLINPKIQTETENQIQILLKWHQNRPKIRTFSPRFHSKDFFQTQIYSIFGEFHEIFKI